jgi:hypothetical protein
LKKPHFEDLGRLHRDPFLMSLTAHGVSDAKVLRAAMVLGPVAFDSATALILNERPVTIRGVLHWPADEMLAMVAKL